MLCVFEFVGLVILVIVNTHAHTNTCTQLSVLGVLQLEQRLS